MPCQEISAGTDRLVFFFGRGLRIGKMVENVGKGNKYHVSIHCLAENPATQVFNQMFNTVNSIIACNCTQ